MVESVHEPVQVWYKNHVPLLLGLGIIKRDSLFLQFRSPHFGSLLLVSRNEPDTERESGQRCSDCYEDPDIFGDLNGPDALLVHDEIGTKERLTDRRFHSQPRLEAHVILSGTTHRYKLCRKIDEGDYSHDTHRGVVVDGSSSQIEQGITDRRCQSLTLLFQSIRQLYLASSVRGMWEIGGLDLPGQSVSQHDFA